MPSVRGPHANAATRVRTPVAGNRTAAKAASFPTKSRYVPKMFSDSASPAIPTSTIHPRYNRRSVAEARDDVQWFRTDEKKEAFESLKFANKLIDEVQAD